DLEHHVAELAMTARLLLVAAALGDALADGLAVGDRRRVGFDRDLVLALETLDHDTQVHFAMAGQDGFPGLLVLLDAERRVLLAKLLQRGRQLAVVLALARPQRNGKSRMQIFWRTGGLRRRLVGCERIARAGIVQLAERNRLAG